MQRNGDGRTLDPVSLAVIGRALEAIPQEMGVNMLKAAYSSIVREAKDMSAALFDPEGQVIGQAEHIPTLLSALSTALAGARQVVSFPDLTPDDVIITNDPYHGAQHLNDICLFSPIHFDGRLVGFSASVAHHLDLGGVEPGIISHATEIFHEGLRFPPMRLRLEGGRLPSLLQEIIRANVRVPRDTIGDLNAQLVANFTGRQRFLELLARYGRALIEEAIVEILDRSERLTRAAIAQFPPGCYTGEAMLDDNGVNDRRLRVAVTVEIRGDELHFDFADSDRQVRSMLNCDKSSATAAVWTAVRHIVLTRVAIPNNAGCYRPIHILMPEGSCLNPRPPASIHGRILTAYRVYDAVMLALSNAVPLQVMATGHNSSTNIALTKLTPTGHRILAEVVAGGWGANARHDGPDGLPFPLSNCSNPPAEYVEAEFDFLRIMAYTLVPDSGGAGEQRGGLGEERIYEITEDDVVFTVFSDRHRFPPPGLFGGLPGSPGRIQLIRNGQVTVLPARSRTLLKCGDLLRVMGGGGGGYGDPRDRAADLVLADLRAGRVSAEQARVAYGRPLQEQAPVSARESGVSIG